MITGNASVVLLYLVILGRMLMMNARVTSSVFVQILAVRHRHDTDNDCVEGRTEVDR